MRLTRQLTLLGASVKQGRPLSPPPVRNTRERRLFLLECPAQEFRVELLAALITSSCGRYAYRPSLPLAFPPPAQGTGEGGIGQRWHHRFCLCHVVRKLRIWCNWWSVCGGGGHVTTQEVDNKTKRNWASANETLGIILVTLFLKSIITSPLLQISL